jgi:hypothetical protein
MAAIIGDADFITLFEGEGPKAVAQKTGMLVRSVYKRRLSIEGRIGRELICPTDGTGKVLRTGVSHPKYIPLTISDGYVLVGSDAHYWPDEITPAHRAFVKLARRLKPKIVVMNGDAVDGASISRHPPIGWESRPTIADEIGTAQKRLREIQSAAKDAELVWTLGNHDGRFETRLATVAPEYAKIHGVHLRDHFPDWQPCWATWVNDDVVIKHRIKGGIHATHNATLWAGKTTVTGHLHSLKVTPFSDYNGVRYGVDTGTMANIYGPQFEDYTEGNPVNWRSGFAVLRFIAGQLMMPQLCQVVDENHVEYLGELIEV